MIDRWAADLYTDAVLEAAAPTPTPCPAPGCDGTVDAQRVITGGLESACCARTFGDYRRLDDDAGEESTDDHDHESGVTAPEAD